MPLTGKYKVCTHSIRGASHVLKDLPNQDAVRFFEKESLLALADGHGGAAHPLSHVGSELAVMAAEEVLCEYREMMTELRDVSERLLFLENDFAYALEMAWRSSVERVYRENKEAYAAFESKDLYALFGTTLLLAFELEEVVYFLQIGDGTIVVYEKEKILFPILEDTRLYGNVTTSLCENGAWFSMRAGAYVLNEDTQMLALLSDGVENAYPSGEIDALDFFKEILETDMDATLSKAAKFSRDDTSGAFWYREDLAPLSNPQVMYKRLEASEVWLPIYLAQQKKHETLQWLRQNAIKSHKNKPLFKGATLKQLKISSKGLVLPINGEVVLSEEKDIHYIQFALSVLERKPLSMMPMMNLPSSLLAFRGLLDDMNDETRLCYACGESQSGGADFCLFCETLLGPMVFIENAYERHQLFYNSWIHLHHLMPLLGSYNPIVGRVIQHPKNPQIWGIENLSGHTWYLNGNEEEGQPLLVGQKSPIKDQMRLTIMGIFVKITIK